MKKAICLSLAATLLLLVFGCVYAYKEKADTKCYHITHLYPGWFISYEFLGLNNGEEYEAYMRSAPIMPAFVTHEMLGALGKVQYSVTTDERWSIIKNYRITDHNYWFYEDGKAETDYSLNVYVKPVLECVKDNTTIRIGEPYQQIYHYTEDLRKSESDGYRVLELKGVQYRYIDGELNTIQWETPSHVFQLRFDEPDKVGRESGTLMSYILYSRTSVLAHGAEHHHWALPAVPGLPVCDLDRSDPLVSFGNTPAFEYSSGAFQKA